MSTMIAMSRIDCEEKRDTSSHCLIMPLVLQIPVRQLMERVRTRVTRVERRLVHIVGRHCE